MQPTFRLIGYRKALLLFFLIWIVASGLYYIDNLFSPNYHLGYEEGTLHKTIKYAICVFFTIVLCLISRAYSMLLLIFLVMLLVMLIVMDRGVIDISTLSILITATMISYALVPSIWEYDMRRIGRITVYTGAAIGVFSIIEMTILAPLFESIWASTGSIRSVSTLFNPSNLGLYSGACLLLLPFLGLRPINQFVCGGLIFYAFVMSGSRTAWVALTTVMAYQFFVSTVFRGNVIRLLRRNLFRLIVSLVALIFLFTVVSAFNSPLVEIEIVNRGADLYTASIRWDNFIRFINAIDTSLLIPDINGQRTDFVHDNFYLVILNSFGVIGLLMFFAIFSIHFSLRKSKDLDMFAWKLVFAFYMVAGLSGSQLNSFPNNQLFFLSLGAVYVLNMRFLRKNSTNSQRLPTKSCASPILKP